jgi:hypothetical protein
MDKQDLALVNKYAGCFGNIRFSKIGLEAFLAERDAQQADKVAALQAEIETLRRDAEEWASVASAQAELHDEAEEAAEKLVEALAELITWFPSADTYRRLGFDPEAPMRALERAKLLLGSGGRNND